MKINKTFETDCSRFILRLDDFNSVLPEEYIKELGNVVICDVALSNEGTITRTEKADTKAFSEICQYLVSFLKDNPETILYFYCDDINKPPRQRERSQKWSMQRFRSELFHSFYQRYVKDKDSIKECIMLIEGEEERERFIHLIYPYSIKDKAELIKSAISEQANK